MGFIAGWNENSLREYPVLLQKRNLVVAQAAMKGIESSWAGLDRPEFVKPQGDRGYGLGFRLICKRSGYESSSDDGQEKSAH
jgi:hypothetical protein